MTVKDFKVGQTVYILGGDRRDCVAEANVAKVGRKYVTIDNNWGTQFEDALGSQICLTEKKDYGTPALLFWSAEDLGDYCEREELKKWFVKAASWSKIGQYTLAQLRAVKKILEEDLE